MAVHKTRVTKISWKLTLIYAGIFSLILIVLNAAILFGVRYYLLRQATSQVIDISQMIMERFEMSEKTMEDLADDALVIEIPSNDNIYVKIIDVHGSIINETPKFNLKIPEKIPVVSERLSYLGNNLLYKNVIIRHNSRPYAYLQVVKNLSNEAKFLKVLFFLMLLADLVGIFTSVLVGWVLSKNMLRPIANITEAAQSISAHGDLGRRIELDGPHDELSNLAMTFNEMIARLQQAFEQQNQFVSNASHELRTPIQVVQGYVNLLDRWGKEDKAILLESIGAIKNETNHMAALVERLLFLARGEQGLHDLNWESFPINRLVSEILEETRLLSPEHSLISGGIDAVNIVADRKLIKEMLRAVIDNSLKFTPPRGLIRIDAIASEASIVFQVEDSGIGIPEADLPNIFERFYQVDEARIKKQSGTGLGLAIVKSIVEAHHGSIAVESTLGTGTLVRMTLPREPVEEAYIVTEHSN